MTDDCPRLARQIEQLTRIYTHLTETDLQQMAHYHSCGECWPQPAHLARNPEER